MDRSWYRNALRGVSRASFARSLVLAGAALGVFLSMSSPVLAQSVCNQTGGVAPTATGGSAFSCGDGATAAGGLGTAFGTDSAAGGGNSVAVGGVANAAGDFSSALGRSATATATGTTAVGFNSAATGENAMAFGANSAASAANAHAFGSDSVASGADSTAIGNAASATASNAVALGAGSVAGEDNTVSIGAAGAERKIVNMAAGTADTDGVNVSQLKQSAADTLTAANQYTDEQADATLVEANTYADTVAGDTLVAANQYTDQQVNQLSGLANAASADLAQFKAEANDRFANVEGRLNRMDDALHAMDRRISRQGAMAGAMAQSLGMPDVGSNYLGAGMGWSEGENAFAASFRRRFTEHFTASVGASRSGDESVVAVGAGITW